MNGKIDKDGFLHIERAGRMKRQECPFHEKLCNRDGFIPCGDWCPLFVPDAKEKIIAFCKGCVYFDTLTDERGTK